jgi:tRNA threonylcarbamoyladenosine biosynthesis protein TsaE
MKTFRSFSSTETAKFAHELARTIFPSDRAIVIALQGDLGAGKTTFTQGFIKGLGVKQRVISPTFVIMKRFKVAGSAASKKMGFKNVYHIDAYRIKKPDALEVFGLKEIFADPANIVLIEWPEKIKKILPKTAVWLKFEHAKKENERTIKVV